jgi:S-adenosylmethionine:tRNA ribosyltransferase-isomerase
MQKVIQAGRCIGEFRPFPVEWHRAESVAGTMPADPDDPASYDYDLPSDLIADRPTARRDEARLLIVDRSTGRLSHGSVNDLPRLLRTGDCMVLNDTRVVRARLRGARESTGGKWEGLFLRATESGDWELLGQTRGRLREGESLRIPSIRGIDPPLELQLRSRREDGVWLARPSSDRPAFELLEQYGEVPLPPYIRKGVARPGDADRYQTVYATTPGSVAAPTAGLHFTRSLLEQLQQVGIDHSFVTLHVGAGTFRPITAERLEYHAMHAEWAEISPAAASRLRDVRAAGGRIVAVGTTSVRVLESAAAEGELRPYRRETSLFIRPPHAFRSVDALLTNFHLPRSTLLVLVSAFAGGDLIRRAYDEAIRQRYRFYSYGDAMLIL